VRLTAARVVLVGAVLLVALGAVYVADRNRAHSRIESQELHGSTHVVNTISDWRARKGWYEYVGASIVVLTLATAFAVSRRER
jgi:hypothetical protein